MFSQSKTSRVFREIYRLQNHYTCHATCDAFCCRHDKIHFNHEEYAEILRNVDEKSSRIIEQKTRLSLEADFYREFPAGGCPLLKGSKCGIYGNRPDICRMYPFAFTEYEKIIVAPCDLGIDVLLDYAYWSGDSKFFTDSYHIWQENNNKSILLKGLIIGTIHDDKMIKFSEYVENTSYEDRKRAREELIKHFE